MGFRRNNNLSDNGRGRNKNGGKGMSKEKITMLVTSLAVLSALTATGIYIGQRSQSGQDNRIIDFSTLDGSGNTANAGDNTNTDEFADGFVDHDDMDIDPEWYNEYRAANSGDVQNPDLAQTQEENDSDDGNESEESSTSTVNEPETSEAAPIASEAEDEIAASIEEGEPDDMETAGIGLSEREIAEAVVAEARETLIFDESQLLAWPIVGNVVINYSMDSYVYFPTLGQYRHNPAIVIAAVQGEPITAAADGVVSDVFYNEEIGNAVTVVLGSGYELTYGQLGDIQVSEGDIIVRGDLLGFVAAPTKYYTLEGSNVYFQMTKDGVPVNPLTLLQ